MNLKDILKSEANKTVKRKIELEDEKGKKSNCDIYVKVLSCADVEKLPKEEEARHQVAMTIFDEKSNPIFTVEELKEIPYYVYIQLLNASNEVNISGKKKP